MTRRLVWLLIGLRFVVIPAWIAAAIFAARELPTIGGTPANPLGGLVPSGTQAAGVEGRQVEKFGNTLLSRVAIVQRREEGLSAEEQRRTLALALAIDEGRIPLLHSIAFALPVTNTLGLFPSSREHGTTAITYLYFRQDVSAGARLALADTYSKMLREGGAHVIGVTGAERARDAELNHIEHALPRVELATVALIVFLLLLVYRTPFAPFVALGAAAIAYTVSMHVLGWAAEQSGASVPKEVEPILVALLLGIVTDYCVFFFSGMRRRLEAGSRGTEAAAETTLRYAPIILTAGLIVALGCATLVAGRLPVFRSFGPGMALTVLISLAVSLTFVPAALAVLGRYFFWPRVPEPREDEDDDARWVMRIRTTRPAALLIAVAAIAALAVAASFVRDAALGFTLIRGQPSSTEPRRAAEAAAAGFAPGIVAPTLLLLEGKGVREQADALARLEASLSRRPGVAGVIGPREAARLGRDPVFVNRQGDAARIALILEEEPFGANAIGALRDLEDAVPRHVAASGLQNVRAGLAGDTALAMETIDTVRGDTLRIAGAVILVNLLLLALFLRALCAPLYLLVASMLGLAASLGLTALVFEHVLGHQDLTYYVPFAASVLLLSLGSDYNLFVTGRIWQEAERRPLRDAVAHVVPRASRTIAVAGMTLAGSFALLALVPIRPMRELAFAMSIGILVDTFVVRSLLVPSLIILFGRWSWWPRHAPAPAAGAGGLGEPALAETRVD